MSNDANIVAMTILNKIKNDKSWQYQNAKQLLKEHKTKFK